MSLDLEVLKNEKWVFGAAEARRRMIERSGAAWVEKGKAKTATCESVVEEGMVGQSCCSCLEGFKGDVAD